MLVIKRKLGERLIFEEPNTGLVIVVEVTKGLGSTLRLAIEAPESVQVTREEMTKEGNK
jgi:carbon storage regulator CsrA